MRQVKLQETRARLVILPFLQSLMTQAGQYLDRNADLAKRLPSPPFPRDTPCRRKKSGMSHLVLQYSEHH